MDELVVVRLPPLVGGQAESWRALVEIAPQLGRHWLLIGGQMVFLHEVERESTDVRPTNDIDLVVDLRIDPAALGHTHTVLARAGFSQDLPSPEGVAHRYRRGEATIDVLAPDHMGARATLALGSGRTIEAPGENVKPDWPQLCSLVLAPLLAGAAGAESVAGVSGFEDVAVEGEAVDDGVDEAGVGDDLAPLAERQI